MHDPAPRPLASDELTAAWHRLAGAALDRAAVDALASRTADGLTVEPFHPAARSDRPIAMRPLDRAWAVVQRADDPDLDRAIGQVRRDVEGGADAISIAFAGAASAGGFGVASDDAAARRLIAAAAERGVAIRIEPHPEGHRIAQIAAAVMAAPPAAHISFGLDFAGSLARWGRLAVPLPDMAPCFAATAADLAERSFAGPLAEADGRPYHDAGATPAQELAASLASAVVYVRALDGAGFGLADAFSAIGMSLSVDGDLFAGIAKLRAARLLWSRLRESCGVPPAPGRIHADTSRRMITAADPHTNLLRTTIAAFAAGAGGADSVCVIPFTAARGLPDGPARRLAANIQHLLIKEAHAGEVADPAAGSGAIVALTDGLAARAWDAFQEIEREGGIMASLTAGALQRRIAAAGRAWLSGIEDGSTVLVGLTGFRADAAVSVPVLPAQRRPAPDFGKAAVICPPLAPLAPDAHARAGADQ